MSTASNFFVRWRVRLGYPLSIAVLYFSQPTPRSILLGALRLHPKSALFGQRRPGSGRGNCHAFVDLGCNPDGLLRGVLFHCDAARGERAACAPRGIF